MEKIERLLLSVVLDENFKNNSLTSLKSKFSEWLKDIPIPFKKEKIEDEIKTIKRIIELDSSEEENTSPLLSLSIGQSLSRGYNSIIDNFDFSGDIGEGFSGDDYLLGKTLANYVVWLLENKASEKIKHDAEEIKSFNLPNTVLKNCDGVLDALHDGTLISKNVKLPLFKKAFNTNGIAEKKIEWVGSVSSLNYFVKQVSKEKKYKWKIAEHCFFIGGKDLTKLQNNKSVSRKDKETIDKAIRIFNFPTTL